MPADHPFRTVAAVPDLPALEHRILDLWRERQAFARLRAQNAGGPTWSFLDGPITANNPMGVHHAWGRAYKDVFQRFHAMLGQDQRWQNGFDCQGLWVEVNVERELGFTSKRDIEQYGIGPFVNLCKQRVLGFAARMTEQSIRLGMWMDWNDPAELRRLAALLGADPAQPVTVEGPAGPVTDSVEMVVGRLGMPDLGGSYFTFSNENNDLIWGFLAECHRRGWLYKGHDTMPWCARCGTGISQMEMNEGYQDREDPGLTVRYPLIDRPGEVLLVWTTTPWTLPANVAAAVGPALRYVKVRQGEQLSWLSHGTLKQALSGPYEVLEEKGGEELVGWRYQGLFDDLPAVARILGGFEHRVVAWDEVGEAEGSGIVHIAPGCGAEDYALGKRLGLPMIAPLTEDGLYLDGFAFLSGRDVRDVTDPIVTHLREAGHFYHLAPYLHRYPHCWRCNTPLVFRLVDEWYIAMGPVYDQPRETLTAAQVDASLRYQIMEQVDRITWIPGFGYERELDWLRNMHDWMISKKRYWGLALPIYECATCGTVAVISGREELKSRAVDGWVAFEGHTPHRPWVDAVTIACSTCGATVRRIADVGNPWLDAGIVPFSTLHFREDPASWQRWFPADFVTESFPGQFRNWFYSMLAMSTVLRREPPFKTLFGYALVFGADGRPMHKSAGNAIEFDEAAERMGVDVMRWTFARARPEENIAFGWEVGDESRRELLVLWNVFAFLVRYAHQAGWLPPGGPSHGHSDTAARDVLDRWLAQRSADLVSDVRAALEGYDARAAALRLGEHIDDLSTWYLRRSRRRFSRHAPAADRAAAFGALHEALVTTARVAAPLLPFLAEELYQVLVAEVDPGQPPSIHLTRWPEPRPASEADLALVAAMVTLRRAVELARTLRAQAGLRVRQPLASASLALPDGVLATGLAPADQAALLHLFGDELNVRAVELIGADSERLDRHVRPLLPVIGKRLGPAIPAVMAAAREGRFELHPDGRVTLAGVTLAPGEVEVQAVPRPGTAVAHDQGLVVVLDTTLTPDLVAEGDARELARATQDLRRQAGLDLDESIVVHVEADEALLRRLAPYRAAFLADTLAVDLQARAAWPADGPGGQAATVGLSSGTARLAIERVGTPS
ncbi:MAG: class I tRNA ligase family protein [Candidatus Limnocylindrales bacterium]